jgi:outer membrane protein assembly factor BamB
MSIRKIAFLLAIPLAAVILLKADWPTFGADPQRTGWNKAEDTFTKDNVKNLTLEWKIKIDNQARELNALTAPVVVEGVITPKGFKEYVLVGGSSDSLSAVDAENGKLMWSRKFEVDNTKRPAGAFWLCPGAQNATPLVHHWGGDLPNNTVFAIASDGKLHSLNVNNGEDRVTPTQFTPPFSKNWSLNSHGSVLYTATGQGCGGSKSGVWAMDFSAPDHKVTFIPSSTGGGAGVWGRGGVAIGKERIFAASGDGDYDVAAGKFADTVFGMSLSDNKMVDYYTPANRGYLTRKDLDMGNTTPAVFTYKDKELVVAGGKEGVIYLLDAASLGGADHRTPLYRSPLLANEDVDFAGRGFWGAFATWEDPKGDRWLFAPALGPATTEALPTFKMHNGDAPSGSIMAFKVEDKDSNPVLTPMWMSRDMSIPDPPAVTNGVVFAVSTGEFTRQAKESGGLFSSAERAQMHTGNAILYAFDAATGKELFSSGDTMPSFTHFSGIAVAAGHVLVTTYDNTLYSFGLKQ